MLATKVSYAKIATSVKTVRLGQRSLQTRHRSFVSPCFYDSYIAYRHSLDPPVRTAASENRLLYFPKEKCLDNLPPALVIASLVTAVVHVGMGLLAELRRMDTNVASTSPLGYSNTRPIVKIFVAKMAIVLSYHFAIGYRCVHKELFCD